MLLERKRKLETVNLYTIESKHAAAGIWCVGNVKHRATFVRSPGFVNFVRLHAFTRARAQAFTSKPDLPIDPYSICLAIFQYNAHTATRAHNIKSSSNNRAQCASLKSAHKSALAQHFKSLTLCQSKAACHKMDTGKCVGSYILTLFVVVVVTLANVIYTGDAR